VLSGTGRPRQLRFESVAGPRFLFVSTTGVVSGDLSPSSTSYCWSVSSASCAHLTAVGVDLLLNDLLDLSEVGGDVEVQVAGDLGDLRFGRGHLEVGVVALDLVAHLGELLVGVLDLLEIVLVRLLVHLELLLVGRQIGFGLLQLHGELRRRDTVAGLQVGLDLGLHPFDLRLPHRHLTGDAFHEPPVQLETLAPLLQLLHRFVVFELHDGDGISLPHGVRDAVEERPDGREHLSENHDAVLI